MLKSSLLLTMLLTSVCSQISLAADQPFPPLVSVDSSSKSFGKVHQGDVVTRVFTITNSGQSDLLIEKIEFSVNGMTVNVKQTIEPGKSTPLEMTWDTKSVARDVEAKALLNLNDPEHPKIMLSMKGYVIAPIEILPMPAFYMSQFRGESKSRFITIKNNRDTDMHITSLEPKGEHFLASIKEVIPGKSYQLHVNVPPDVPIGRYRDSIIVHTDDPLRKRIHIEVNVLVKPDVYLVPDNVNFGHLNLAELTKTPSLFDLLLQTVLINRREGLMTVRSVESDIYFLEVSINPEKPSQAFRLEVGLKAGQLQLGTINGTITLKTDDPDASEIQIPVSMVISK